MLDNNFVEEYRRLETPFNFNYNKIFTNNFNELILTSNHHLEKNSYSFSEFNKFYGNSLAPKNSNIIFDSLTILSTNPNLSGFLPFKFTFSGNKPQVDFSNPTRTDVERYGYIKNNNIGVISGQYSKIKAFQQELNGVNPGPIVGVPFSNFGSSGKGFYALLETGNPVEKKLFYFTISTGVLRDFREGFPDQNQVYNMRNFDLGEIDDLPNQEITSFEGNLDMTFFTRDERVGLPLGNGNFSFTPLIDGSSIYNGTTGNIDNVDPIIDNSFDIPDTIVTFKCFDYVEDIIIYLGYNFTAPPNDPDRVVLHALRRNLNYDPLSNTEGFLETGTYTLRRNRNQTQLDANNLALTMISLVVDRNIFNYRAWTIDDQGNIYQLNFDGDRSSFNMVLIKETQIENVVDFAVAISENNQPLFTVISTDPTPTILPRLIITHLESKSTYRILQTALPNLKRLDGFLFYLEAFAPNFINLIDGTRHLYDYKNIPGAVTSTRTFLPESGGFGRYFIYLIDTSRDGIPDDELIIYLQLNERYPRNNITYKYTFHYDFDRVYPFDIKSGFQFQIENESNVNFNDLEIFRILLDIRIRYTKEKINPFKPSKKSTDERDSRKICRRNYLDEFKSNGSVVSSAGILMDEPDQNTDELVRVRNRRFRRCLRETGDVNRILGLVPEDFTVNDFLNIYI